MNITHNALYAYMLANFARSIESMHRQSSIELIKHRYGYSICEGTCTCGRLDRACRTIFAGCDGRLPFGLLGCAPGSIRRWRLGIDLKMCGSDQVFL